FNFRRNVNTEGEEDARVQIHKGTIETKWNIKDRNSINARLELAGLNQVGAPGFSAEYELREGLQPGFNTIWQVFFNWYLLSNVELNLTYDGRSAVETPMIHTGRIQVRAFF
ncbi:MAG: hypothetical protein AAF206_22900, partial [Bacteroidota bacterium]